MKTINRLPGLPIERTLAILSGRWKAVILHVLLAGPQRTCDLEQRIVGISQKVLIEQLRALEEHAMVSRQPSAVDRQGIEYRLTPLGESLRPILESLIEWGIHHATELDEVHRLLPCDAVVRNRTMISSFSRTRGLSERICAASPNARIGSDDHHVDVAGE